MVQHHAEYVARGVSRRDFLGFSAGAAAAGIAGGLSIARSAHAAGSDVLKIGLIGCGGRGAGAAVNAMNADKNAKLVAMADVFEERVKGARIQLQKEMLNQVAVSDDHCFVGFDAYQKVIASGVDVVLIACASKFHPVYLKAAVDAGKHVFVEKPHAIDPPGVHLVEKACEVAKQKNLSVVSGLCWRYDKGVQETIKRVLDGAIGEIVAIQETYMRSPYRLEERRKDDTELQAQFRNWYHFNWLSGDDVPQSLLHSMDKGCWALREQTPASAFASAGRSSCFGPVYGDVFDHGAIVYEYANGARIYALCRTEAGCYDNATDVVMGTKGRCYLGECRIEGENKWKFAGQHNNPYLAEQKALVDSVLNGKPINSGYHMANSTLFGVLGQLACYSGKPITFEEAAKSNFRFGPAPEESNFDTPAPTRPDGTGNYPLPLPGVTKLL